MTEGAAGGVGSVTGARIVRALTAAFVTFFVLAAVVFIFAAGADTDEGLFIYASRLVYDGKVPYRDFQFPQMPLLAYVYGLPQLVFGNSMYSGRMTSVVLLGTSALLVGKTAQLLAGPGSRVWIALLLGTNWWFIYLGTLIKTHALVYLLIAASMYVCAKEVQVPRDQRHKRGRLLVLASVLSAALVLTRLPSLGFVVVLIGYTSWRAALLGRRWLACNLLGVTAVAAVAVGFLTAAGWEVFWFNNLGIHALYHEEAIQAGSGVLGPAVWALNAASRMKDLLDIHSSVFPIELFMLGCAVLGYEWWAGRHSDDPVERSESQLLLALMVATLLLAVSPVMHFLEPDYSAIAFPTAAVVIASVFGRGHRDATWGAYSAIFGRAALVVFLVVAGYHGMRYSVPSLGRLGVVRVNGEVKLPLGYVREIAAVLREHRKGDGTILTAYLSLAHQAGLSVVSGLELAESACQPMPDALTARYKNVNRAAVLSMIRMQEAEYVIVSRGPELIPFNNCDWSPEAVDAARSDLKRYYNLLAEFDDFAEHYDDIVIYQRTVSHPN